MSPLPCSVLAPTRIPPALLSDLKRSLGWSPDGRQAGAVRAVCGWASAVDHGPRGLRTFSRNCCCSRRDRCADRLDRLATEADASPVTVVNAKDDQVAHPALTESRQQSITLARLLVALRMPSDEEGGQLVRPQRRGGVRGAYGVRAVS